MAKVYKHTPDYLARLNLKLPIGLGGHRTKLALNSTDIIYHEVGYNASS